MVVFSGCLNHYSLFSGATTALNPKNEYFYYYTAETSIGIPEIAPTYSIVGIRCNVSIQVPDRNKVIVQMNNVEVATDVKRVQGGMNGYSNPPLSYSPVSGEARALEEPFNIYLRRESGVLMDVPKTDKEWLTNIRKSIASIIRVYPIIEVPTMKQDTKRIYPSFFSKEYTIFGHCDSQYTVKNISYQFLPMPGGRPGPTFGNEICQYGAFNVTRSINFNQCSDMTLLQQTGLSNRTTGGKMNHGTIESRTSVSHYTVCGKEGEMQIQNMTTQGLFASNPFGYETEKMQAVSNQTFRLSYIRPLRTTKKVTSGKEVKTWLMEIASPFVKENANERPWVNFYNEQAELYPYLPEAVMTGESYDNLKKPFTDNILQIIKRVAVILTSLPEPSQDMKSKVFDTAESEAPNLMQTATRLIRSLDKHFLVDIWNTLQKLPNSDRNSIIERILYTDALAASGSSAAIMVLLDEMEKGGITDYRSRSIFMTMTNNIVNPEIIEHLVKYVMKLKITENPYLTISAHVNMASAVRRSCTDTKISTYSLPMPILGNRRCDPSGILKEYWGYLEQQLQNSNKPFERAIWVEAIANLGTTQALPVIKEVIAGHHGRNASIRVMGVYALLHYRMPDAPRYEISKILTPIYEDFMEDMQIRQTAILVHATWKPDNSFWQTLASLSWRDPSKEIGSFIYSLMSSTSKSTDPKLYKQGEFAKQALSSSKPYPPSIMYAYSYLWARLSPSYHLATEFSMTKISSNESVIPREMFSYLYNSHGGLDYTLIEQCAYAFNADEIFFRVLEKINTYSSMQRNPRLTRPKEFLDFFKIIKDELHFKGKDIFPYQIFYVMRLFDHMEYFVPIDKDILDYSPKNGENIIDTLLKGTDINLVKYFDPAPIEMYLPLENGLPMAYRISYPIIISIIGYAKLKIPNVQNPRIMDLFTAAEVDFGMDKNAKYISTYISNVGAIVPWDKSEVYTETYMTVNVNDPSQFNVTTVNSVSNDHVNSTLAVYVKPSMDREYPVAHSHNKPVVGIRSMWPDKKDKQLQEIYVSPEDIPVERMKYALPDQFYGISGYFRYNADIVYPFTMGALYDYIQNPQKMMRSRSSTAKRWDYELVVNPGVSATKAVNISTTVWAPTTVLSLPLKNYTHVNEQNVDYTRDYPYGFTARALFNGSVNRYYEASVGVATVFDKENIKDFGIRATFRRSELPGYSDKKSAFCINMTSSSPKIFDFEQLIKFINEGKVIEAKHEGQLYLGEQCQQNKLGSMHGHLRVSEEEKHRIEQVIGRRGEYTPFDPLGPYYDRSELVIDYDDSRVSQPFRNMTYLAYDIMRGYAFPHVYFGYTNIKNSANKIKVQGRRLMKSQNWNGTVELPTETAIFESQQLPRLSYQVIPSGGISQLVYECIIDESRVRTFDDVWYDLPVKELKDCWTVAAINKKYPERLQVLVRRPVSGFEVMLSSSEHQINIEVHKDKIMVNGEKIVVNDQAKWVRDSRGVPFAQVISQWGKQEVSVPGNVTVSVSDKRISIMPIKSLKGKVNGVCGDFNTELENEMIGPENCYYQNATKFSYSWTTSQGQSCNKQFWNRAQADVKKFQGNCARAYPQELEWELMKEKICEAYIYPIKQLRDAVCVSTNSVGMCINGCIEVKYITTEELYYCYLYDDIPADVKPYMNRGYITHFPQRLPDVTQTIRTRSSFICQ